MLELVTLRLLDGIVQYEMYAWVKKDVILKRVDEELASSVIWLI
jgi:hypothetical protein